MGWWQADSEGNSLVANGELVWGDGPADIVATALDKIDQEFLAAWGRKPTVAELVSGVLFSVQVRRYEETIENGNGLADDLLRRAVEAQGEESPYEV